MDSWQRCVLDRLREALSLAAEQLTGEAKSDALHRLDVLHAAREMDSALDALHKSMEPLTHPVNPLRIRRQRARYIVRLLDSCAYHVRSLAAIAESASDTSTVIAEPSITDVVQRLDHNAATLADYLRDPKLYSSTRARQRKSDDNRSALQTEPSVSDLLNSLHSRNDNPADDLGDDLDDGSEDTAPPTAETLTTMRVLRHLQRVDEALLGLGRPLGLSPAAADSAADQVNQRVQYPA